MFSSHVNRSPEQVFQILLDRDQVQKTAPRCEIDENIQIA